MKKKYLAAAIIMSVSTGVMAAVNCEKNPTHSSCVGSGPSLEEIEARVKNLEDRLVDQDFDSDGYYPSSGDCDDSDFDINPGAFEIDGTPSGDDGIDNNCDGIVDNNVFDSDGDGHYAGVDDCDDNDPTVFEGNTEWYTDNRDHNCDPYIRLESEDLALVKIDPELLGGFSCTVILAGWHPTVPVCGEDGIELNQGPDFYGSSEGECLTELVNTGQTVTQRCQ